MIKKVEAKRDIIIINLNSNLNLFKERSDLNGRALVLPRWGAAPFIKELMEHP